MSSPGQNVEENDDVISSTSASVECQTNMVYFTPGEYEELSQKSAENIDIKGDLEKLKKCFLCYDPQTPVIDPHEFESICMLAGVSKLFATLHMAINSSRMSDDRQGLTKLRVMVVIHIMFY